MVGILRRFLGFRGKSDPVLSTEPTSKPAKPKDKPKDKSFFLDPDEAKTLGNIEYMRTPKTVRHTFLDFGATEKVEIIEQVSALGKVRVVKEEAKPSATPSSQASQGSDSTTSSTLKQSGTRRQAGSDMDTFRNMARSLKRK